MKAQPIFVPQWVWLNAILYPFGTLTWNQWHSYPLIFRFFYTSLNVVQGRVGCNSYNHARFILWLSLGSTQLHYATLKRTCLCVPSLTAHPHPQYMTLLWWCFLIMFSHIILFLNGCFLHWYFWDFFLFYFQWLVCFKLFLKPELFIQN